MTNLSVAATETSTSRPGAASVTPSRRPRGSAGLASRTAIAGPTTPEHFLKPQSPLAPIQRGRRSKSSRTQDARGRYRNVDPKARLNANGLGEALTPLVDATPAVVPDPMEKGASVIVAVNRRVDLCEYEYACGHLSEAAYQAGRKIQRVFEKLNSLGAGSWTLGDRVDTTMAHELAVLSKVQHAQAAKATFDSMVLAVGMVGARALRSHLVDNLTYQEAARARGKDSGAGVVFQAKYFRKLLEDVAESWAAVGADPR